MLKRISAEKPQNKIITEYNMSTTSIYKPDTNKNDPVKKPIIIKDSLGEKSSSSISISPNISISPSIPAKRSIYDIASHIDGDTETLALNNVTMVFCIYKISTYSKSKPFLQYLLYKYPTSDTDVSDMLIFPFVKYSSGKIVDIAAVEVEKIIGSKLDLKGHIELDSNVYLFYDASDIQHDMTLKLSSDKLWWCLMDEIYNSHKVISYPIHPSVHIIFDNNPNLVYLRQGDKKLDMPAVGYYGGRHELVPILAAQADKSTIRGKIDTSNSNRYYFSTFKKAIRDGSWSHIYDEDGNKTDIDGRYENGGVVRYALFLDNIHPTTNISYDEIKDLLDNSLYDTVLTEKIDYDGISIKIDPEYSLKHTHQYISLSYHSIDAKLVGPNWDVSREDYKIL